MELCTGGNLYEVIDAPENAYGLSEQEFMRVMVDVGNVVFNYCCYCRNARVFSHCSQWDEIFAP